MSPLSERIQRFEFEGRMFISFGFVAALSALSFTVFASTPANSVLLGRILGLGDGAGRTLGFLGAALTSAAASFLRIWSGSVLTSRRMMSFKVKADALCAAGPYRLVRNPIYLADLMAFGGFVLVLPPVGALLPVLLYLHYVQLIRYEESSLRRQFGETFRGYEAGLPRLLPDRRSLAHLGRSARELICTWDGFRHNALYLLFIPGFLLAARSGRLLWALAIGLPAVVDWGIIHTVIGTSRAAAPKIRPGKVFADILYANCWEDPRLDRQALAIGPEDIVLSITSGGCNSLTFLLDNPRKVISLDANPCQNHLLELKMAAIHELSHEGLLEFCGVRPSASRPRTYASLRPRLSPAAARYWDGQAGKIARGLIHAGRYERYMRLLRRTVAAPLGRRGLIERFFACDDPADRERLFREQWNGWSWKLLTGLMLSRRLNVLLFDKAFFAFLDEDFSFGRHFASKAEQALVRLPIRENSFLSYILRGRFVEEDGLPLYLRAENQDLIRDRLDRIEVVTAGCADLFAGLPDGSISKFNFSNIFEWMSPAAFEALLRQTVRVARDGALLTYRNLLVRREHPAVLEPVLRSRTETARALKERDLSFIYENYVVEEVRKG